MDSAATNMRWRKFQCRWLQFKKFSATIWQISIPATWIGSSIWPANTDLNRHPAGAPDFA
jgi:hypothetical protein